MNNNLISYFKKGMEKGQTLENITLEEKDGMILFSGNYEESKKIGYKHDDKGIVEGKIKEIKDEEGNIKVISIKALYDGIKDSQPYNYSLTTSYELYENGINSVIYKIELDSRTNEMKETYFKSYAQKSLAGYEASVNYSVLVNEGEHFKQKSLNR